MAGASSARAMGEDSDADLRYDLRTAIILAAYPCKTIVAFSQKAPLGYQVSCSGDRQYLIRVDEQEMLQIGELGMPGGATSPDNMGHVEFMNRQLFSIVNLAGYDCGRVLRYELLENKGHVVTCNNQMVYRVHVTAIGQVAVDTRPN